MTATAVMMDDDRLEECVLPHKWEDWGDGCGNQGSSGMACQTLHFFSWPSLSFTAKATTTIANRPLHRPVPMHRSIQNRIEAFIRHLNSSGLGKRSVRLEGRRLI